jgi:hypothetical protein
MWGRPMACGGLSARLARTKFTTHSNKNKFLAV